MRPLRILANDWQGQISQQHALGIIQMLNEHPYISWAFNIERSKDGEDWSVLIEWKPIAVRIVDNSELEVEQDESQFLKTKSLRLYHKRCYTSRDIIEICAAERLWVEKETREWWIVRERMA